MNSCNFIGNFTRDPELRYLPNNTAVCNFGLAISEKVKKSDQWVDQPVFIDCTAFGRSAENISKFFGKGNKIGMTCRARLEQWEDKQTGAKRSKIKFIVDRWSFTDSKSDRNDSPGHSSTQQASVYDNPPAKEGEHVAVEEEDVPF